MPLATLWLGGARGLAALLGFATISLLAPMLGPAELGRWSILLAAHGFALHLAECGMRSVITAEAGTAPGRARALLPAYLRWRLTLAVTVGLAATLIVTLIDSTFAGPALLVMASLIAIACHLDWIALVEGRHASAAALLLVRPMAMLALVAWIKPDSAIDVAPLFLAAWFLASAASWPERARAAPGRATQTFPWIRRGLPLAGVSIGNQALVSLDLVVIGWAFGAASAGHFALAAAIATAGLVFANAQNQLTMAQMSRNRGDAKAFAQDLHRRLGQALVLALVIAAAMSAGGSFVIPYVLGEAYRASAELLLVLVPWLVLTSITAVLQGALVARGRDAPVLLAGNIYGLVALSVVLAIAWVTDSLVAAALARSAAELPRLLVLLRASGLKVRSPDHLAVADGNNGDQLVG